MAGFCRGIRSTGTTVVADGVAGGAVGLTIDEVDRQKWHRFHHPVLPR